MAQIASLCGALCRLTVGQGGGIKASTGSLGNWSRSIFQKYSSPLQQPGCSMATLNQMHRKGPFRKVRPKKRPTDGVPQLRGVVLKVLIKKPKKPNSANRKCVRVRLSNGREATAYVPGEGHNLQEHSIVLCRGGRLQDVPGVRLKCIRGKYDLAHVVKKEKVL